MADGRVSGKWPPLLTCIHTCTPLHTHTRAYLFHHGFTPTPSIKQSRGLLLHLPPIGPVLLHLPPQDSMGHQLRDLVISKASRSARSMVVALGLQEVGTG